MVTVTAAGLVVTGSMTILLLILCWTSGFHQGWRQARHAEIRRVRERQARTYARQRRSTRL